MSARVATNQPKLASRRGRVSHSPGYLRLEWGVIRAILAFSATFYFKSLFVTSVTGAAGINSTMAKNKSGFAASKAGNQPPAARAPKFKAPTPGQEDVIFKYGAGMRPGAFQGYLDALSGHMASVLKKGGAQAAKAIRQIKPPTPQETADPASNASKKDESSMSTTSRLIYDVSRSGKTSMVLSTKNFTTIARRA